MIVLDTSAILGLEDGRDQHHDAAVRALEGTAGPAIIPMGILAEVDHLLTNRIHRGAMERVRSSTAPCSWTAEISIRPGSAS